MDYCGANDWWAYLAHTYQNKNYKYLYKIQNGTRNGKPTYRYFYSEEEYQTYLHGKQEPAQTQPESLLEKAKKLVAEIKAKTRKAADKVDTVVRKLLKLPPSEKAKEDGKNFVEEKVFKKKQAKPTKYIAKVDLGNGKFRYFYLQEDYDRYLARLQYRKEEPDFMKDVPKIDILAPDTKNVDQEDINEEYDVSDPKRSENCIFCTNAYELRQRGYDVQAGDSRLRASGETPKEYQQYAYSVLNWYEDPDFEVINSDGTSTNATKLMKYWNADTYSWTKLSNALTIDHDPGYKAYNAKLSIDGDGLTKAIRNKSGTNSRGMLNVTWALFGGGHSIVYEVDRHGNVVFRDAQSNKIYSADSLAKQIDNATFIRTDNLKLKPDILYTVEDN